MWARKIFFGLCMIFISHVGYADETSFDAHKCNSVKDEVLSFMNTWIKPIVLYKNQGGTEPEINDALISQLIKREKLLSKCARDQFLSNNYKSDDTGPNYSLASIHILGLNVGLEHAITAKKSGLFNKYIKRWDVDYSYKSILNSLGK